jgi:hypothetical protein
MSQISYTFYNKTPYTLAIGPWWSSDEHPELVVSLASPDPSTTTPGKALVVVAPNSTASVYGGKYLNASYYAATTYLDTHQVEGMLTSIPASSYPLLLPLLEVSITVQDGDGTKAVTFTPVPSTATALASVSSGGSGRVFGARTETPLADLYAKMHSL